jgi:hypothetical protein
LLIAPPIVSGATPTLDPQVCRCLTSLAVHGVLGKWRAIRDFVSHLWSNTCVQADLI